ncbi:hypothetical protein BpHYR1_000483, partial [Brachionus plicatilis]
QPKTIKNDDSSSLSTPSQTSSNSENDDFQILTPNPANWLFNGHPSYLVYSHRKYCSCKKFLEFGICRHFIASCKLTNKEFDEVDREFVQLKKEEDLLSQKMETIRKLFKKEINFCLDEKSNFYIFEELELRHVAITQLIKIFDITNRNSDMSQNTN